MPFDLERAAERLRSHHGGALASRHAMLDLLFATGLPVREQAMALEFGDALSIEVAGPAAPSLAPPLVLVVVDLDPPHLAQVSQAVGAPPRWAPGLASLGGPSCAVAWAACLRALVSSPSQRPWRAHYVRGPAMGLSQTLPDLLGELEPEAEVVLVVPSVDTAPLSGASDLVRVDLTRSRNVWRFPACDHSYALSGDRPWRDAATALNELVEGLGADVNWTLHDLHIYQAHEVHISAVLRTSAPITADVEGFTAVEVDAGQRLMFPVNDALGALQSLAARMSGVWGDALHQPVHLHVLPDGVRAFALVPAVTGKQTPPVVPSRVGSLAVDEERVPVIASPPDAVLPFAVGESERLGPVPAGVGERADVLWQFPTLREGEALAGLLRALGTQLARVG